MTVRSARPEIIAPPARSRRKPTRLERAIQNWIRRSVRAAAPYGAAYGLTVLAGLILRSPLLVGMALGGAGVHGTIRLHEAHGWHRKGGKAAMRRRRRFQGTATRREIRANLSPAAARAKAAILTPDLDPAWAPVIIGAKRRQVIAGSRADSYLLIAPPQSIKTALISCWAADAPGALLATSSRGDLYRHTAVPRSRLGDLHVPERGRRPRPPRHVRLVAG